MQFVILHSKVTSHSSMGMTEKSFLSVGRTMSIKQDMLDAVMCGFYTACGISFTTGSS